MAQDHGLKELSQINITTCLTHWGWVMHICANKLTIIGSDNGLSPGGWQAIIWTNAGILSIRTSGTNFSEISSEIHIFSFNEEIVFVICHLRIGGNFVLASTVVYCRAHILSVYDIPLMASLWANEPCFLDPSTSSLQPGCCINKDFQPAVSMGWWTPGLMPTLGLHPQQAVYLLTNLMPNSVVPNRLLSIIRGLGR